MKRLLLSMLVSVLSFSAVNARASERPELQLRIDNNLRVFKDASSQRQYVRDYCRFMACAASNFPEFDASPYFCSKIVKGDPIKRPLLPFRNDRGVLSCPAARFKGGIPALGFWVPNSEPLQTYWSNDSYKYTYKNSFLDGVSRSVSITLSHQPTGKMCTLRVTQMGAEVISGEQFKCDGDYAVTLNLAPNAPYAFEVSINGGAVEFNPMPQNIELRDYIIVALGDSISSGEGIPHRLHDPNKRIKDRWWESRCHRSFFNFSLIASMTAAEQAPGSTFTYFNFACSGATISRKDCSGSSPELCQPGGLIQSYNGLLTSREMRKRLRKRSGDDIDGFAGKVELPSQIDSMKSALVLEQGAGSAEPRYRRADYVVMTIGGNDVLFGRLVFQSLLRKNCKWNPSAGLISLGTAIIGSGWQPSTCLFKEAERLLSELDKELEKFERELNLLQPRNVLIAGYIDPTHDESDQICADEKTSLRRKVGPSGLLAKAGYVVDSKEAERAYRDVLTILNKRIEAFVEPRSAKERDIRWRYLNPNIIKKSQKRGWCGTPSWFVNYDDSSSRQNDSFGTAHPNIYGQNWLNWLVRCNLSNDKVLPAKLVCPDKNNDTRKDYVCDCGRPPQP